MRINVSLYWITFSSFLSVFYFGFPLQKILAGTFSQTNAGRVCLGQEWFKFEHKLTRQACSPLIQSFFKFASDIDQTNINRDIRDGNWLSSSELLWSTWPGPCSGSMFGSTKGLGTMRFHKKRRTEVTFRLQISIQFF